MAGCKKCGGTLTIREEIDEYSGYQKVLQVKCINCGGVSYPPIKEVHDERSCSNNGNSSLC